MKKVQEPTSRIPWQPLIGLVALIAVMSVVVPSEAQLKHVPPAAPSFKVLHTFAGSPTDGASPVAGLLRDAAGYLYGTTSLGGAFGYGVVFKLSPAGTETVLHSFTGGTDGAFPSAGLVRDAAGNLYGTASDTTGVGGYGVVFKIDTTGTFSVLYSFTGGADGAFPYGGVVLAGGNLYGAAAQGGPGGPSGNGVVFRVNLRGEEAVLYSFTGGADGGFPQGGLVRDAAGNLYGTTYQGGDLSCSGPYGSYGCGTAFKLDATNTETVLHSFTGGADGANLYAGLFRDAARNLYGATPYGGAYGKGVVFKLSPCDSSYDFKVLYNFTGGADGSEPFAGLIQDAVGNLYGTTTGGGASGKGVVFELIRCYSEPSGYEYKVLYSFAGGSDGANPQAGLIQDAAGNLYGTTNSGGAYGLGVVFRLTP